MSKTKILVMAAAAVLLLSGCLSVPSETVKLQKFDSTSEAAGQKIAADFAGGFIGAMKSGDFTLWQRQMPEHISAKVNAGMFEQMKAELTGLFGGFESGRYLGCMQNRDLRDHLWVLRFSKSGNVREVIYMVRVFRNQKGEAEISGFGVKRIL